MALASSLMSLDADRPEFAPPPQRGTPRAVLLALIAHALLDHRADLGRELAARGGERRGRGRALVDDRAAGRAAPHGAAGADATHSCARACADAATTPAAAASTAGTRARTRAGAARARHRARTREEAEGTERARAGAAATEEARSGKEGGPGEEGAGSPRTRRGRSRAQEGTAAEAGRSKEEAGSRSREEEGSRGQGDGAGRGRPRGHAQAHAGSGRRERRRQLQRHRAEGLRPFRQLRRPGSRRLCAPTSSSPMPISSAAIRPRSSTSSLAPDGTIVGTPSYASPAACASWDEAAERALRRTEKLPRDVDGRMPPRR